MNIGILGSGVVGQTLGAAFLKEGHRVAIGTGNISKPELAQWQQKNKDGQVLTFAEAAQFGDVLVLAVSGTAAETVIHEIGAQQFAGKVVIDATNPIAKEAPQDGVLRYFTGANESLMERLQTALPHAKLVKAFNSVGSAFMYNPSFAGGPPTMFICGNDSGAKEQVGEILKTFGWEVADMGTATAARAIEPLAILWCLPGFLHNQWTHAFKLLKN